MTWVIAVTRTRRRKKTTKLLLTKESEEEAREAWDPRPRVEGEEKGGVEIAKGAWIGRWTGWVEGEVEVAVLVRELEIQITEEVEALRYLVHAQGKPTPKCQKLDIQSEARNGDRMMWQDIAIRLRVQFETNRVARVSCSSKSSDEPQFGSTVMGGWTSYLRNRDVSA